MTNLLSSIQSLITLAVNIINTLYQNELFIICFLLYFIRSWLVPLWDKMRNKF